MSAPDWRRLQGVPLFATLPEAVLRRLWETSGPRHYAPGETLRSQGTPADHLLVLLDGTASATATTTAGRVIRFGTWAGPCALDKVALLDGAGHTATFTALTPCAVRAVPRGQFTTLLDDCATVRAHVFRLLATQARAQQERLTDTATLPCEARLATWLLDGLARDGTGRPRPPPRRSARTRRPTRSHPRHSQPCAVPAQAGRNRRPHGERRRPDPGARPGTPRPARGAVHPPRPLRQAQSAFSASVVARASAARYPLGSFGLRITTERQ